MNPQILTYYPELFEIRKFLEINCRLSGRPPFPSNACEHSSYFLEKIFDFPAKAGNFSGWDDKHIRPHAVNHDTKNGVYIDLTMDQFGYKFPKVNLFSDSDSGLFVPCEYKQEVLMKARREIRREVIPLLEKYLVERKRSLNGRALLTL